MLSSTCTGGMVMMIMTPSPGRSERILKPKTFAPRMVLVLEVLELCLLHPKGDHRSVLEVDKNIKTSSVLQLLLLLMK